MSENVLVIPVFMLVFGVLLLLFKVNEVVEHLGHIRRMLGTLLDGRMEPDTFIERMHRITVGASDSAKHLKSIDARMNQFTNHPDDEVVLNMLAKMTQRMEANKAKDD